MNKYKKAKKTKRVAAKLQAVVEQQKRASNPKLALELHYKYKELRKRLEKLGDVAER